MDRINFGIAQENRICLILFFLGIIISNSDTMASVPWVPCVTDGFGHPEDGISDVGRMAVFRGYLYVGKNEALVSKGMVPAKMYRISDKTGCDVYEPVVGDGAKTPEGFGTFAGAYTRITVFKNALYCAIDAELWRTFDGIDWQPIAAKGGIYPEAFGDLSTWYFLDMEIYNDMLYIITQRIRGSTVWRSADGTTWEKVVGDGLLTPAGFLSASADAITAAYICSFKGALYALAHLGGPYGLRPILRTYDGIKWDYISDGIAANTEIDDKPVVFKNWMYTQTDQISSTFPIKGDIWRTYDGLTWEHSSCPDCPYWYFISDLYCMDDYLYMGTDDYDGDGCMVFRTKDGNIWELIAQYGFYSTYKPYKNWYVADMIEFNNQLYVGTGSASKASFPYKCPCDLWRTDSHPILLEKIPMLTWKGSLLLFLVLVSGISVLFLKMKRSIS